MITLRRDNPAQVISAATVAKALAGRKVGSGYVARCPAHDDRNPSLSIRELGGKPLVHCFAGCSQEDVINALERLGLWGRSHSSLRNNPIQRSKPVVRGDGTNEQRSANALSIWHNSIPATGTLAEAYLASRGLTLPIPSSLRFHPNLFGIHAV